MASIQSEVVKGNHQRGTNWIYRQYYAFKEGSRHVQYRLYKRPSYTFRSVFFFCLLLISYSPSLRIQLICESKCWGTHVDTSQDPPFSLPYQNQKLYEAASLQIPSDWNRCPVLKANADRPSQNDIHTHAHTHRGKGVPNKGLVLTGIGRLYLCGLICSIRERLFFFFLFVVVVVHRFSSPFFLSVLPYYDDTVADRIY